jgi:hypothetical protein
MGEDKEWVKLRGLLQVEIHAMNWRLSTLSAAERDGFLDELTDRLFTKVHLER